MILQSGILNFWTLTADSRVDPSPPNMETYNEKFLENSSFLEESEMSDKTGKINPERRSHQST
jgi:hypothetical protein